MPPRMTTISQLTTKIIESRLTDILSGSVKLLVSPVFYDVRGRMYIQPIFDFDVSDGMASRCYDVVNKYFSKTAYPCHIELTPNGAHLVFDILVYDISIIGVNTDIVDLSVIFRNFFKKLDIPYLDVTASFRDVPIYRAGSYKDNYTIFPIRRKVVITDYDIGKEDSLRIMNISEWIRFYKSMFMLSTVSFKKFLSQFK